MTARQEWEKLLNRLRQQLQEWSTGRLEGSEKEEECEANRQITTPSWIKGFPLLRLCLQ